MNKHLKLPRKFPLETPNIDPDYIEQETVEDELDIGILRENINLNTGDYFNYYEKN